MQTEILTILK